MYFLLYQHLCIHVTHYLYMHVLTVLHLHPKCGYSPNCTTFSNSQWKKFALLQSEQRSTLTLDTRGFESIARANAGERTW
jgi:hypothetical protein